MNVSTKIGCMWLLLLLSICQACTEKDSPRITFNMNNDWAFFRGETENGQEVGLDDSQWIPATVPHIMQLEKKHCGGNVIYDASVGTGDILNCQKAMRANASQSRLKA